MNKLVGITLIALAGLLCGCASFKDKPLAPAKTAADFEARSLDDAGLRRFVESNLHQRVTSWNLPALTLAALYFHPDMDVARARWGAAEAAKVTAGQRPNPTLSVSPAYDTTTTIPSPWIVTASLDIPIETAGKRGYRIAQAAHLSEAARLNIATAAWQVRSRVRSRWVELYAATRSEELLRQQEAAQAQVVKLLKVQLDAGAVSPFEVTQAQIAQRNASLALNEAQRQRAEARVALADALGVPARALDGVAVSFDGLERLPAVAASASDARRQAMLGRADIRSALAEYAASQSALQLQIARQWPDVHLGPGYEYDQGDNKWSVGLSVELPMLNQNQGGIAEAKARREEAAARFIALQARVVGEIDRALAGYNAALRKAATAETLLSDQRRQRQTAQRMFEAGETARLAVATAETEVFTTELSRLDALVKVHQALGALEDAVQQPLLSPASRVIIPEKNPRAENTPSTK
ncbi:MAG: TolC family protein [Verrucomicrobiae bacterium]|nr:TolC family protein [Verrucomicrobiae bacterium]